MEGGGRGMKEREGGGLKERRDGGEGGVGKGRKGV